MNLCSVYISNMMHYALLIWFFNLLLAWTYHWSFSVVHSFIILPSSFFFGSHVLCCFFFAFTILWLIWCVNSWLHTDVHAPTASDLLGIFLSSWLGIIVVPMHWLTIHNWCIYSNGHCWDVACFECFSYDKISATLTIWLCYCSIVS